MLKFLAGPVLLGAGYLTGSIYGRNVEQLVHKTPDATYSGLEVALDNVSRSGMTSFDGGTPMPYELQVERTPGERLHLTLLFAGRTGATADIQLKPHNEGKETLLVAKLHGERSVLRSALAGTAKAKLAYAPDWMLNLTARPLLAQMAAQIEEGETASLADAARADPRAEWEAGLTSEQREQMSEWQQYQATRPAIDPSAAASNFTSGNATQ